MRILKINIENFGTLSQEKIDVDRDLYQIIQENGWGKTTLATFIKCIFYGLGGRRKQSTEENEFKKYRPWQGGAFGGSIVFEAKGKVYRVERFFEDNAKGERFTLFDAQTGLKSTDYSERLGEELFFVNAESFERSIYLPQKELKSDKDSGILRYLENSIENKTEDSNYDTAAENLEKAIKYYVPARANGNRKGRLEEINEELTHCVRNIENCNSCIRECQTKQQALNSIRQKHEATQMRIDEIQERIKAAKSADAKNALQLNLKNMIELAAETEEKLKEIDAVLNGQSPSEEELDAQFALSREISDLSSRLSERKNLSKEEFLETDVLFENVDNQTIRQMKDLAHVADEQRRQIQSPQKNNVHSKIILPAFIIAGILIAFGAVLAFYFLVIGIVLMGVGVLVCITLLITGFKKADSDSGSKQIAVQERAKTVLILDRFLSQFGIPTDELSEYFPTMEKVELKYLEYCKRAEKTKIALSQNEALEKSLNEKQDRLRRFFSLFALQQAKSSESALFELQKCVRERTLYRTKLQEQYDQIAAFKRENDIAFDCVSPEFSYDELIRSQNEILSSERKLTEQALNLTKEIEDLENKADELPLLLAKKQELTEKKEKAQSNYDVLLLTKTYLNQAKESLSGNYLIDMKSSFLKYFSLFRFGENEQIFLDTDLNISIERYGSAKEVTAFSRGIQDIIGLCLRFALLDAMYQGAEKPTVVLDDPFVNLDDKRLPAALKLLRDLSTEYQIIYLTCSRARLQA